MNLGILVHNLGPSQLNYYLIRGGNAALLDGTLRDLTVFYETLTKPCLPMTFAAMQAAEAWGFDDVTVATTLSTAQKAIRFPSARRKVFYVWDLEWLRLEQKSHRLLHDVYGNPNLELLARSEEHKQVIESCWNRPVLGIVEDMNFEQLTKLLK